MLLASMHDNDSRAEHSSAPEPSPQVAVQLVGGGGETGGSGRNGGSSDDMFMPLHHLSDDMLFSPIDDETPSTPRIGNEHSAFSREITDVVMDASFRSYTHVAQSPQEENTPVFSPCNTEPELNSPYIISSDTSSLPGLPSNLTRPPSPGNRPRRIRMNSPSVARSRESFARSRSRSPRAIRPQVADSPNVEQDSSHQDSICPPARIATSESVPKKAKSCPAIGEEVKCVICFDEIETKKGVWKYPKCGHELKKQILIFHFYSNLWRNSYFSLRISNMF